MYRHSCCFFTLRVSSPFPLSSVTPALVIWGEQPGSNCVEWRPSQAPHTNQRDGGVQTAQPLPEVALKDPKSRKQALDTQ